MFRKTLLISAIVMSSSAFAEGMDWTGFYAGAGVTQSDGVNDWSGTDYPLESSTDLTVLAGYNHQFSSNFVLGAEVSNTHVDKMIEEGEPEYYFENFLDLKVKAGYSFGKVFTYVSAGVTRADYMNSGDNEDETGSNYGIGADFAATKNIIIGVQHTRRNITFTDFDSDTHSTHLTISYKFN